MESGTVTDRITQIINPALEGAGYELVRILMIGSGKPTVQIMVEKPDGTGNIDDYGHLSQEISALLDVEDVIDGAYFLEVSSPGIDRPLTRLKDFRNYQGHLARIELHDAFEGQKKFKGTLIGVDENNVISLQTDDGAIHGLAFAQIRKARLILTDDLLKSAQNKHMTTETEQENRNS